MRVNASPAKALQANVWMQDSVYMKTHLLRYFVALAEEQHFGKAAQRLSITQPPLSMALKTLESELGVALMERNAKHVHLTPAGEALLVEARKVLSQIQRASEVVRSVAQGAQGRLNVGITGSMIYRQVPDFCRTFQQGRPLVEVCLHEISTREQIGALISGELDVGFLNLRQDAQRLETLPIGSEPLVCCMPAAHPLAENDSIDLHQLEDEVFVMFAREVAPANYDNVIACLQQANIHPHTTHAARQWLTVVALVSTGQGVALVPQCLARAGISGVRFLPLNGVQFFTPAYLAWRRDQMSPLVDAFVQSVQQQVSEDAVLR